MNTEGYVDAMSEICPVIYMYIYPETFWMFIHRQFRPSIPWVKTRSILCFLQALRLQLHSS